MEIVTSSDINIVNTPNINSNLISVTEDNECPICFEHMVIDDPILILECCNKKTHIKCIMEWYSKHRNNKCFICNQTNKFCNSNYPNIQTQNSNDEYSIVTNFYDNCCPFCIIIVILIFIFFISRIFI